MPAFPVSVSDRAHTLHVCDDGRGIAGFVAQFLADPHRCARHLVERHHPGVAPPRAHDDAIAVDERRLADQPVDIAAVEFTQDVAPPDDLAVSDKQTDQIAVLGEHVDTVTVDSGSTARTRAAIVLLRRTEGDGPGSFTGGAIEARHDALAVLHALHEDATACDRDRAIARSQLRRGPDNRGTGPRPLPQEPGFARHTVPFGTAPLGPVGRWSLGRHCNDSTGDTARNQTQHDTPRQRGTENHFGLYPLPLESNSRRDPKRPRPAHLADETGRRERAVRERHRDVLRVERVADPPLDKHEPAANAGAEIRE